MLHQEHETNIISNEILLMSNPKQLHKINGIDMIHQLLRNKIFYLILSLFRGDVQRGVHVLGDSIDLGAVLKQQHDNVDVSQSRGDVQRRLLFTCASIDLGTVA